MMWASSIMEGNKQDWEKGSQIMKCTEMSQGKKRTTQGVPLTSTNGGTEKQTNHYERSGD